MKSYAHCRLLALLVIACALTDVRTASGQNLVGNPSFENGPADLAPWALSGIATIGGPAHADLGDYEAEFAGDGVATGDVSQVIATTALHEYLISFYATSDGYDPTYNNFLDVSFGTGNLNLSDSQLGGLDGHSAAPYVQFSFDAVAAADTTSTSLSFIGQDQWGNIWLDDVSVTDLGAAPVPEPGSLVLMTFGFVGFLVVQRSRPSGLGKFVVGSKRLAEK
ncbi:MAG TPA: PEP-CTERM sorting domain-containing protein [Pirellulales bacterium]|jgi:hypothetical protein|nr:PEP-CTERM sorting domain-containing protein [Pirellulales bacterium]